MPAPSLTARRAPLRVPPLAGLRRSPALLPRLRLLGVLVACAALLAGGWLALRDSALVKVTRVEVTGVSGPQRSAIRSALEVAGTDMTTLHVRPEVLRAAVAPYAVVAGVTADARPPHGLVVHVTQRAAIATIVTPQGSVPVAADGTVLPGTTASAVPDLRLKLPPAGDRISDPRTLGVLDLLAAAPAPLRTRIASALRGPRGLTIHLADGPSVTFGTGRRLAAKWASLTAVLASPASKGTTAIDVRVPERPAAAGLEQAATQRGQPSTTP